MSFHFDTRIKEDLLMNLSYLKERINEPINNSLNVTNMNLYIEAPKQENLNYWFTEEEFKMVKFQPSEFFYFGFQFEWEGKSVVMKMKYYKVGINLYDIEERFFRILIDDVEQSDTFSPLGAAFNHLGISISKSKN